MVNEKRRQMFSSFLADPAKGYRTHHGTVVASKEELAIITRLLNRETYKGMAESMLLTEAEVKATIARIERRIAYDKIAGERERKTLSAEKRVREGKAILSEILVDDFFADDPKLANRLKKAGIFTLQNLAANKKGVSMVSQIGKHRAAKIRMILNLLKRLNYLIR